VTGGMRHLAPATGLLGCVAEEGGQPDGSGAAAGVCGERDAPSLKLRLQTLSGASRLDSE
jgi:hypothetical protein